jgi:hypothetical protein
MTTTGRTRIKERLNAEISAFEFLSEEYRNWFESHRIEPRVISLAHAPDGLKYDDFWLITDHTGQNDSSFRVFYDEAKDQFGRECLLENDVPLLLALYPSLEEVLDDII